MQMVLMDGWMDGQYLVEFSFFVFPYRSVCLHKQCNLTVQVKHTLSLIIYAFGSRQAFGTACSGSILQFHSGAKQAIHEQILILELSNKTISNNLPYLQGLKTQFFYAKYQLFNRTNLERSVPLSKVWSGC